MIGVGHMRFIKPMLALALALAGGGTFAQSVQVADSAFQRFLINTTGVGQQTIGFTGSGQPVPQFSGGALAGDGGSGLRASGSAVLRNPAGGQIPVSLSARVPPQVLASFARRAVPLLGAAYLASDLYDLVQEYGFDLQPSGVGFSVVKSDPAVCSVAPCVQYSYQRGLFRSSRQSACLDLNPHPQASSGFSYSFNGSCAVVGPGVNSSLEPPSEQSVPPSPPSFVPSSLNEFEAAVASDSSVPLSSSAARAIEEARRLLNEPIPLTQPEVSGPVSSPGATSTTTKPDGSTVTITQTFNHTYNGPTISTTTTTTTSTVPAGGGPVQTETTVQTPDPVQQEPEPFVMPCGVPGSPPCSVKVDETGMATADDVNADRLKDAEDEFRSWLEGIAAANPFPDIPWDFALPTACGVIPTPAFAPAIEEIDICQFQPMFHELMSVVWMLGGLFGAISLFMRNSLSQ